MEQLLKTLLHTTSDQMWVEFRKASSLLKGLHPELTPLVEYVHKFQLNHDIVPDLEAAINHHRGVNDEKTLKILEEWSAQSYQPLSRVQFVSHLEQVQRDTLLTSLVAKTGGIHDKLSALATTDNESLLAALDDHMTELRVLQTQAQGEDTAEQSILFGSHDEDGLRRIYSRIQKSQQGEDGLYFDIGLPPIKDELQIKRGDLIFLGGFISHGKSILLRYALYHLVVYKGLNAAFVTLEMSHDLVRPLFSILHANNKEIFPGTPVINYTKFKNGELSEEEEDFLFNVAEHDLLNNPNYGTLVVNQPRNSRYSLEDFDFWVKDLEKNVMPVHVVGLDYLTLMWPVQGNRGKPEPLDYNNMIKAMKNIALSHRNAKGVTRGFIAIVPAQISRRGYDEAQKNEGKYEVAAFAQFSEIERSADVLMTVLMDDEARTLNQLKVQVLKNRDGALPLLGDPFSVSCNLANGFGISAIDAFSVEQTVEIFKSIDI